MDNSVLIAMVAVVISLVSIILGVAGNFSQQSDLIDLNRSAAEQSQTIASLNSKIETNSQIIESLKTELKESKQLVEFQNRTITNLNYSMDNQTRRISSLEERVNLLEQKIISIQPNPSPFSLEFKPQTVVDDKGVSWTSHYIKQDLYDPAVTPSCSSPPPDCYVHISKVKTIHGDGIEVDTNNSGDYGYYLLAYSNEYVVPSDGVVTVTGKFLKTDQLPRIDNSTNPNSLVSLYILGEKPDNIVRTDLVLTSKDPNDTWLEKRLNFILEKGGIFRIGIGRNDGWLVDYNLYASWSDVSINAQLKK